MNDVKDRSRCKTPRREDIVALEFTFVHIFQLRTKKYYVCAHFWLFSSKKLRFFVLFTWILVSFCKPFYGCILSFFSSAGEIILVSFHFRDFNLFLSLVAHSNRLSTLSLCSGIAPKQNAFKLKLHHISKNPS